MKIMIAGLGSIGRRHCRNLLALGQDDIILFRTHKSTIENENEEFGSLPTETDLVRALAHKPNAVIIANPTALHLDVALAAANAGCHLLIEKPISHSLEGVENLGKIVHENKVRVLVGFQFRFHKRLRAVKQWLQAGIIGKTLEIRAHYGDYLPAWHPWEDYRNSYSARADLGGGVVFTLSHPLDYCRWLMGEVSSLWAFTVYKHSLDIEVDEMAEIGLRFKNGALGSIHLNYSQRPSVHKIEIVGSDGIITWSYEKDEAVCNRLSAQEMVVRGDEQDIRNPMFLAEMKHFLALVNGEEESCCTLYDGIRALELALAVHTSSQEKRMVEW